MERHERIARAIKLSGKKKGEIASLCGVANSAVTQWVTGESKSLRPENLYALAKATGFRAEWLAIGEGDEQEASESNVAMAAQPTKSFRYPVVSWVAAGSWAEAVEPYPAGTSDTYEYSEYDSKGPAFWLKVKGDSMTAPAGQSITEGTLILVDTEAEVLPGKLVVAKLPDSNEATFKKLVSDGGQWFLKPLNPGYPIQPFNENCRIVGVVVQALQKFY
ncbi:SOS response transcriptional repressor, RecA-mediated autopeptidase [Pseudomonas asplenii]|uniref:SOS response transcriptional repressor, RecA-mediated autopeptidase n=1 Tax=Pseudomonas asplenii TaxID=53407 RepID=A0A0N0E0Z2_9PSED|nr:XRE family transcriptional regulator [Pseudomonas fuscovaginae]KPA87044.1 SOS response transcriptional repressor, RecA-mediated autopeptidase [Pseudomonas fuscovaginae]